MMSLLRNIATGLRSLFRKEQVDRELDEELRAYLEMEAAEKMKQGMSRKDALRAVRLERGSLDASKEVVRSAGWEFLVETSWRDLRYGVRMLCKNPGFTIIAVVTLALGIGANTAIFSVVDGVLLEPLPYPNPEELVAVWHTAPGLNIKDLNSSDSSYFIYREQSRTFQDIGLYRNDSVNITGMAQPERVSALDVTDGVLPILRVRATLGRTFTRADDSPGGAKTVILSFAFWQRKFGGDRSVIGKTITADGELRQVIGVLPRDFHFGGGDVAMLLPLQLDRANTFLGDFSYESVARLKPGVTLAQASADVARMLPIVEESFPMPVGLSPKTLQDARIGPNLRTLKQEVVGDMRKVLWVLMGGIGLVLLIACANVGNLLLVRAEGRQHELAIRAALGASKGRIAAGLLLESFLLALLGCVVGLALAYGALRVLVATAPTGLPRINEIAINGPAVLFTLVISLFVSLLFGCVPAFKYAGVPQLTALRESRRFMSDSRHRHRARNALVVFQVALALVLLVSAGLMIRTFRALIEVDPGFVMPSEIQTFRVDIPYAQVKEPERVARIEEEILHKIEAVPGVSSVSLSMSIPLDGNQTTGPAFEKGRAYLQGELPLHRVRFVAPGFFKTLGTRLVAGRDLTWRDIYKKVPVAIVSERMAREYWHDPASALGKQIRVTPKDDWREIIGVVGDVHDDGVDKEAPSSVYWPILTSKFEGNDIDVIRSVAFSMRASRAGSASLMEDVQKAVWSVDSDLPIADAHMLEYYYSKSMARTSFTLTMLGVAGGMALLLGVVGLYGAIAYSVSTRTHEIGIRVALGAESGDVLKMVVRGGFKLAGFGVGIGIVAALVSTRYLASLLYGIKPSDPPTFATVALLLIGVALLASYIPARQATKVDPMVAIRYE
jgi:predicted permease